jgi:sec-independent protein translocase protein TatA
MFLALPGPPELIWIFGIIVILFGAKKLPGLARAMGSSISQFKRGLSDEAEKTEQLSENAGKSDKEAD